MHSDVIVIGGGPAGMISAGFAAKRGKKVVLLDKNEKLGKKLFITGKGRCNFTNNCDIQDIIDNVIGNRSFLYSAFYTFTNQHLIKFFNELGVPTKVERGNRVFPMSDKSSDIIKALEKFLRENNVNIELNQEVKNVFKDDNKFSVVLSNNKVIQSNSIIIATGGMSYPRTGSTGDGYDFAKRFGHSISDIKPSLIPLVCEEKWIEELQGLSLKNVNLKIYKGKNNIYSNFGEMLFTHYGISGPIVLSASRHLVDVDFNRDKITTSIDLKPSLTYEQLDRRIQRDFEKLSNKDFSNSLDEILPKKLIPVVIQLSNINKSKKVNQITKSERLELVNLLKNFKLNIVGTRPIREAIVTCGGVNVNEINPSNMESKIVPWLYFAGEIIDVDAYTGGYNLQIAFSTGYLAGNNVLKD